MRNKTQIQREARNILAEFVGQYPILSRFPIRVSARMTRSGGSVRFRKGQPFELVLSLPFHANEDNDLRETVTHEAAHVVAGIRAGHGPQWKMIHRSMGGTAARCHSMTLAQGFTARRNRPRVLVEATCPKCGKPMKLGPTQARKHARGAVYSHGRCPR
jgi:NAD-dependent dihydropyrimidine dehydrogenase PreA subunit